MASGDVQEPYSLSFRADSIHSGSVSFGRFEGESLSWERRSSFLHNRYLEEVEKYARPGSVTEKKAYFEAHFRRRALERQASSVSQVETVGSVSDYDSYGSCRWDENNGGYWDSTEESQQHVNSNACQLNESPEDSDRTNNLDEEEKYADFSEDADSGSHVESMFYNVYTETIINLDENPKDSSSTEDVEERAFEDELNSALNGADRLIDIFGVLDSEQTFKSEHDKSNTTTANAEHVLDTASMKHVAETTNVQQAVNLESISDVQAMDVHIEARTTQTTEATVSGQDFVQAHAAKPKAKEKTISRGIKSRSQGNASLTCKPDLKKEVAQSSSGSRGLTPLKTKTPKQASQLHGLPLHSSVRITKKENSQISKTRSPPLNKSEKDLKPKKTVAMQPKTPERTESRGPPTISNFKGKQVASTSREIKRGALNTSFRSEGGGRRREESEALTRQPAKSLMVKGKPLPPLNHRTVPKASSAIKPRVEPNSTRLSQVPRTPLQVRNQRVEGSISSTKMRTTRPVSPCKSEGASGATVRRRDNDKGTMVRAHPSPNNRHHNAKASQTKEVVQKREKEGEAKGKKPVPVQQLRPKNIEAGKKVGTERTNNSNLRKNMHLSSTVGH